MQQFAKRYLGERRATGASSRGVLGRVRRRMILFAQARHRGDLAAAFTDRPAKTFAERVTRAIEALRSLPMPTPSITDAVDQWLPPRIVEALHAHDIRTLADLTVRTPRRRRWWLAIAGLGIAGARRVEAFFATHPALTERARALIVSTSPSTIVAWEHLRVPNEFGGSHGQFRAPKAAYPYQLSNQRSAVALSLPRFREEITQWRPPRG